MKVRRLVYLWEINEQLANKTNFLHVTLESRWDKNKNQRVGTASTIISSCHHNACMREDSFYYSAYCKYCVHSDCTSWQSHFSQMTASRLLCFRLPQYKIKPFTTLQMTLYRFNPHNRADERYSTTHKHSMSVVE